jgi:addiction module HigA family antidote
MASSEIGLGFRPPHPGEVLKQDILPQLGMTVGQLADHLGVTRATLSDLLNERKDVSHIMAIRLGKAFRNGTRFWLALQLQYDLWKLEEEEVYRVEVDPLPLPSADGEAA